MTNEIMKDAESRMKKAIEVIRNEFSTVRTGRASSNLLDRITIDYFGVPTPINQVSTVSAPDARLLTVQPWDQTLIPVIEKAIMSSDLGLTPSNDGKLIRLPIPPLNEERRSELVKIVKRFAEEGRVSIRAIRRDVNDTFRKMEKSHEISEDEVRWRGDEVQKLTDKHIEEINSMLVKKEEEILEV